MMFLAQQAHSFEADYVGQTTVHPVGLAALLTLGLAILLLPRNRALVPVVLLACFVAPAQRVAIFTLDFNFLRLLVIFGWLRVLFREEFRQFRWHPLDALILIWGVVGAVAYVIQRGNTGAVIFQSGQLFDTIGLYFLMRWLIQDWSDLQSLVRATSMIAVPVMAAFLYEKVTRHNLFAFLGGVSPLSPIRHNEVRVQGAFPHPIIAGVFWAAWLPLFGAQWFDREKGARALAILGIGCGTVITFTTHSSTPVAAAAAGLFAALLFPVRGYMRHLRWALAGLLVALHVLMKAPVWHLIARIDLVGGSTGWHRYHLIDEFINRVSEWGLVGTRSTYHWGYQLFDVTNQYVAEGVNGGIVTLALFVALITVAFQTAGRLWRTVEADDRSIRYAWALGASLFVHVAAFWAVSYFGQIDVIWYLPLAALVSLYHYENPEQPASQPLSAPRPKWPSLPIPR
jgi:hypothetical protein